MSDDQFSKRLEELFSGAGRVSPDPVQPAAPAPDAAAQARLADLEAAVAEARRQAEEEQVKRAAAAAKLTAMQAAVTEAEHRASSEQSQRAAAAAELRTLQARLAEREAAYRQTAASTATAEANAQTQLAKMQAAAAEAERRAQAEQAQREAAAAELQALQAKLAQLEAQPRAAVDEMAQARQAEMQAAVVEAQQRMEDERTQRQAAAAQLEALRAKLAELEAENIQPASGPAPAARAPRAALDAASLLSTAADRPRNIFDFIPPTTRPLPSAIEKTEERARNAWRMAVALILALAAFDLYSTYNLIQSQALTHILAAGLSYGLSALVLAAAWLARRKRPAPAAWLMIIGVLVALLILPLLGAGLGLVYAVMGVVVTSVVAGQSLNATQSGRSLMAAVLAGIGMVLLDVYLPGDRPSVANQAFTITVLAAVVFVYGVIVLRQYRNYSLRTKIVLGVLLTAGVAVMTLGFYAFNRAQAIADFLTAQLQTVVKQQAEQQLTSRVAAEADKANTALEEVQSGLVSQARYVASLYDQSATLGLGAYWDARTQLTQLPGGQWINQPADPGALFIPAAVTVDDQLITELNTLAYLDLVGPAFLQTHPTVVGFYYSSLQGETLYYPHSGAAQSLPPEWDDTVQPYFTIVAPANNPDRTPAWTVPHQDPVGTGLIVTNSAPVYDRSGRFRGVLSADLQLASLAEQVGKIRVGNAGYAFMVDPVGRVIAMPAAGYDLFGLDTEVAPVGESPERTILGKGSADLQAAARRMFNAESGLIQLPIEGQLNYIAFAPLSSTRYSLAVVVPVADLTGAFTRANEQISVRTADTIRLGVILLAVLLILAALVSLGISQIIAAPLVRLTQTAEQITAGHLSVQARVETDDETGTLARSFNAMTAQLRSILQGLEERVAERTRDLWLAAEVGQQMSTVRDLDLLLAEAVETIRSRFDLYYTQVYLTNPGGTALVLRAGTGSVGRELLKRGHRLPAGHGSINGTAATEKHPVLVEDTLSSAVFRPNSLLPDTRSEVAVPLLLGERVVGVLDLQSARPGAFTSDNLPAFQTLAGQLVVAIENAGLFAAADQARATVAEQARRLSREGWQRFLNAVERSERLGFAYDQTTVAPLSGPLPAAAPGALQVPIVVTGQSVGTLHLEADAGRAWSEADEELAQAVAQQVAQQVEHLRLLADAERARAEAEQATRRLTRESWQDYGQAAELAAGYEYDLNQVRAVTSAELAADDTAKLSRPLLVRGESVGELQVLPGEPLGEVEHDLVTTVAGQLSAHIESLRLYAQAETSAQRAKTLVEHAPEAIVVVDVDTGLFTEPNQNAEVLYGLPRSELIKVGPAQMSPPVQPDGRPSLDKAIEKITEALNGGAPVFEWIHRNAQGRDIPCEVRLVRMPSPGHPLVRASVTDITARKEAETALAKRAVELATVADVSIVAATILEAERLLQEVVDLTQQRFGLYHAHIYLIDETQEFLHLAVGSGEVGRQLVAQRHTIPAALEQSLVARAARTQQPVVVNDVRADPGFLPNPLLPATRSELALPLVVGSRLLGVLDVQADTVNRFTAEDVQVQATLAAQVAVALQNAYLYAEQAATVTRLREIDHLKSSFLANMSHELRTPLNSILGFTDVMLEGLDGEITDRMATDLQVIQKNGHHLLNLINDVLDMAKIEAGKLQLTPEPFNLEEVLDEVLSITAPLADAKALNLFVDPASSRDLALEADRFRLRQVMLNLVNNAIKFTDAGSVSISAERENGGIRVAVQDTGLGIPADHLELIFQEFTQVDISSTRKVGGTGLGLPISRKLVELHGGRLWAESTGVPGEGSRFIMELPVESRYTPPPAGDLR